MRVCVRVVVLCVMSVLLPGPESPTCCCHGNFAYASVALRCAELDYVAYTSCIRRNTNKLSFLNALLIRALNWQSGSAATAGAMDPSIFLARVQFAWQCAFRGFHSMQTANKSTYLPTYFFFASCMWSTFVLSALFGVFWLALCWLGWVHVNYLIECSAEERSAQKLIIKWQPDYNEHEMQRAERYSLQVKFNYAFHFALCKAK